ncbi:hypothetical protein [Synechocystis sp. PCC 7509]|uniref:hypothetical protein n=1 Tax=Synechocystis sp. PCC 7509 TaxID=927677 RepID=UPI0002ACA1D9|nr:hypothetical protein [Synechocystis sp. PCC 7509]
MIVVSDRISPQLFSDRTIIKVQGNKCDRAGFWIAAPLYDRVLKVVEEKGNE